MMAAETLIASRPSSTAPVAASLAEFRNVAKVYRDPYSLRPPLQALHDVSFRLMPGSVCALLGPNRAGKTTLVKILLSLCQPTGGTVQRQGRPLSDRSTLGQIGYVHENHAFPKYLTAAGLLEYYGALTLLPIEEVRRRVPELLRRFGLGDRDREPIARFSKGMMQRLGMAQALLNEPQLLVLDEPTEGLDLAGRHLLREAVAEVKNRNGSVLLVSHVLPEVERLCDRAAVLVQGRLAWHGPMTELLRSPRDGTPRSLEAALEEVYHGLLP